MKKLCLFILILFCNTSYSQIKTEKELLDRMVYACGHVRSSSFILESAERKKDGRMDKSQLLVKMKNNPVKIYLLSLAPNPGAEGLWRQGEMSDHVLINPNGFPFINLRLDPYNALLRKDSHHTVKDIGFDYLMSMVEHYRRQLGDNFYTYLSVSDTLEWDGRRCIRLVFDYPRYSYERYTVKKGQNATTIGIMNYVNDYLIVCANREVKDFHDVRDNQTILIPNMFGRKVVFYLDRATMLPLVQEIYDEKGLFEKYELKSFVLNPKFAEDEFSPGHKGYGF